MAWQSDAPWRAVPRYEGGGGRRSGGGNRMWRCTNPKCLCGKNQWHWLWCKHCGQSWKDQQQSPQHGSSAAPSGGLALLAGTRFAGHPGHAGGGQGCTAAGGASDAQSGGGALSASELETMVQLCEKAGEREKAQQYRSQLNQLQAAAQPAPHVRAESAHKQIMQLEKKLSKEIDATIKAEQRYLSQQETVRGILAELDKYDIIYKEAITALHTDCIGEPDRKQSVPQDQPAVLSVERLLAGDESALRVEFKSLFDLDDFDGLTNEELSEVAEREKQMSELLSKAAKELFGPAAEHIRKLVEAQEAQKVRMAGKRRRMEGQGDRPQEPHDKGGVSAAAKPAQTPARATSAAAGATPRQQEASALPKAKVAAPASPPPKCEQPSGSSNSGEQTDVRAKARSIIACGRPPDEQCPQ